MEWSIKHFSQLTNLEVYEIAQLRIDVFIVEQQIIASDCDNKDLDAYHLQIRQDNKLVGYLRILDKGVSYPSYSIGRVIIHESARRQKLGEKMIEAAIQFIEDKWDGDCITISAQAHLTSFYERNGFKIISEPYIEDGIPHIKMQWKK